MQLRRLTSAVVAALLVACVGGPLPAERRYDRKQVQAQLERLEQPGLVIGEFALAPDPVVDGDTIRVARLATSLRLLAIDAEETFKKEHERRAFEAGWEAYKKEMRGDSNRPVKYATPLGEEAKRFAKEFFSGVEVVRLERDDPKEIRDYYNRYLAYVFARKGGRWVNFNVESVRAGMSPYFSKYGYSRRFHDEFVRAQDEARAAGRGIWAPGGQHYEDYAERLAWWDKRGDFIRAFEREAGGRADWIVLTNWDALRRLEQAVGAEVTVLASVKDVQLGDGRSPSRVRLSRRLGEDFTLIFWDKDVLRSSGIEAHVGEFVKVRGFVSRYANKRRQRYELQMVIQLPGQIEAGATGERRHDGEHAPSP